MSAMVDPRINVGLPPGIIWEDVQTGVCFDSNKILPFRKFAAGKAVLGGQFGDEGKGKEVDSMAEEYKRHGYKLLSIRGQGSGNAGHTVQVNGVKYDFHYLTSAGLSANIMLLGPGMLIDPIRALKEMEKLPEEQRRIVMIAERATISTDFERFSDAWGEAQIRESNAKIGTTGSGVGPGTATRAYRYHVTFADAIQCKSIQELRAKFLKNPMLPTELKREAERIFSDDYLSSIMAAIKQLNVVDSVALINKLRSEGDWAVILEVSQAVGLDPLFGNGCHLVTSTPTTFPGAVWGSGLTFGDFSDGCTIITKSYTSKVGGGALLTQFTLEEALIEQKIRAMTGGEKGVTTGRLRNLGWPDAVLVRVSISLNDPEIVVNCMDVIGELPQVTDQIKLCFAYKNIHTGEVTYDWPYNIYDYMPLYVTLPIAGKESDQVIREYILLLEAVLGRKITRFGVGPGRGQYHPRNYAFDAIVI